MLAGVGTTLALQAGTYLASAWASKLVQTKAPNWIFNETVSGWNQTGKGVSNNGLISTIGGLAGTAIGYAVAPFAAQSGAAQFAVNLGSQAAGTAAAYATNTIANRYFGAATPAPQMSADQLSQLVQNGAIDPKILTQVLAQQQQATAAAAPAA